MSVGSTIHAVTVPEKRGIRKKKYCSSKGTVPRILTRVISSVDLTCYLRGLSHLAFLNINTPLKLFNNKKLTVCVGPLSISPIKTQQSTWGCRFEVCFGRPQVCFWAHFIHMLYSYLDLTLLILDLIIFIIKKKKKIL